MFRKMDHNAEPTFRITFGLLGFIKPMFDRGFKVVFFNFGQDITGVKGEISSLNLFEID